MEGLLYSQRQIEIYYLMCYLPTHLHSPRPDLVSSLCACVLGSLAFGKMASAAAAETTRFCLRTGRLKLANFRKEFLASRVEKLVSGQRLVAVASAGNFDAAMTEQLSRKLGEVGAAVTFVKNSLTAIGLKNAGLAPLGGFLRGPTCVIAGDAEVEVAKRIVSLQRAEPSFMVLGAMLEGRLLIQWDQVEDGAPRPPPPFPPCPSSSPLPPPLPTPLPPPPPPPPPPAR